MERPDPSIRAIYHADFDTTLQRYELISIDSLKVKLKRLLLYNSHILVPEDQAADHKLQRSLLASEMFQDFLMKYPMDDLPPVLVGMDPACETLVDVLIQSSDRPRVSSSNPRLTELLKVLRIRPTRTGLRFYSLFSKDVEEIVRVSDFLKNNKNMVVPFKRDESNYNKLVHDAIDNFPMKLKSEIFESYLDKFKEVVCADDGFSRSDLILKSEELASEMKVPTKEKIKLQFVCQDIPYNINTLQGPVSEVIIGRNAFTQPLLEKNPLTEESLELSYARLEAKDVDPGDVPILGGLSFDDVGQVRKSPGFEGSLKDLESSGNRNKRSRKAAHDDLIATALVTNGKIPNHRKSKILSLFETANDWKVPTVGSSITAVWTVLAFVIDPPQNEVFAASAKALGLSMFAYGLLNGFAKYYDSRIQKHQVIEELALFRD